MDGNPRHRCALYARELGIDPIGSAGSYEGYLLVEVPMPWPAEITDHPALAGVGAAAESHRYRVQAIRSHAGLVDHDGGRVVHYRRPDGPFSMYERRDHRVPVAGIAPLCLDILHDGDPAPVEGDGARDVLVCTHGSRDVCCGSTGQSLFQALAATMGGGDDVRLWRTSHTGGHRFAPTAICLPEGQFWAHLDLSLAAQVLQRSGPARALAAHYRGCSGLDGAFVQAVEREALSEEGWGLLGWARSGEETMLNGDPARRQVRLDAVHPDGGSLCYQAVVEVSRILPVPDCGRPLEDAKKTSEELRVVELEVSRSPGRR